MKPSDSTHPVDSDDSRNRTSPRQSSPQQSSSQQTSPQQSSPRRVSRRGWLIATAGVVAAGSAAWLKFGRSGSGFDMGGFSRAIRQSGTDISDAIVGPDPRIEREKFFKRAVDPRIVKARRDNVAAAERAIGKVRQLMDGYRRGIEPFTDDITSWGTRLGVLRRMPGDWWREENHNQRFIAAKTSDHLFDDYKLKRDLAAIVSAYRDEVTANQNAMVGDIKAAVSASDLGGLPEPNFDTFADAVAGRMNQSARSMATDSLRKGILTEIGGLAGGLVVEQLVAQIFTRLATTAAAGAGGSAATTTAAGGGGGTIVGGPVGTAVGLVAGLIVGLVIDWWSTRRVKEDLRGQLGRAIDAMERAIIEGDGSGVSTVDVAGRNTADNRGGMRAALDYTTRTLDESYRDILRHRIVGDRPGEDTSETDGN